MPAICVNPSSGGQVTLEEARRRVPPARGSVRAVRLPDRALYTLSRQLTVNGVRAGEAA